MQATAIRTGGVSIRRVRAALAEVLRERDAERARRRAREILPELTELAARLARVRGLDPALAAVGFGPAVEHVLALAGGPPGAADAGAAVDG